MGVAGVPFAREPGARSRSGERRSTASGSAGSPASTVDSLQQNEPWRPQGDGDAASTMQRGIAALELRIQTSLKKHM
eukprot:1089556-Pyramimonas_sp.AAC.1